MSKYIEKNLGKDESVIIYAKKNWLYLLPTIVLMVALIVVAIVAQSALNDIFEQDTTLSISVWILFFIAGVIPFIKRLLKLMSIQIALTNKRLIGKEGLLRLHTLDVPIDKLDHVDVSAGIFGNLFHYYTLIVVSVGGANTNTRRARNKGDNMYVGISNAQEFKNAVTAAIEQHGDEARRKQAEEIARAMGR